VWVFLISGAAPPALAAILVWSILMPVVGAPASAHDQASLGAVVAVFQWGHGSRTWCGPTRPVRCSRSPDLVIGVLFRADHGLPVFMVSRIHEAHTRTGRRRSRRRTGFRQAAPVVLAAAASWSQCSPAWCRRRDVKPIASAHDQDPDRRGGGSDDHHAVGAGPPRRPRLVAARWLAARWVDVEGLALDRPAAQAGAAGLRLVRAQRRGRRAGRTR
jgi:hypothetical protein